MLRLIASRRGRVPVVGLIGFAALSAQAQEAAQTRAFSVVPSISVTQTFTDNVRLNDADKRLDGITQIQPGIHLSSNAGRVKGSVDYALDGLVYARDSASSAVQQRLSAALSAEAVENFAFIDARASIGQESVSALGLRTPDSILPNSNRTEVSSLSLSPYVHGVLASRVAYEGRLNYALTRSSSSNAGESTTSGGSIHLSSAIAGARLGWGVDYTRQNVDFTAGRETSEERLSATLRYVATPDLTLSVRAGREVNSLDSADGHDSSTSGWNVLWTPTERTTLSLDREQRFFGSSYSVRFNHRTPRTVWNFSSTRGITGDQSNAGNGSGSSVTVYDLLFQQFASVLPDPIQRDALVNAYLRDRGIDKSALAVAGFLTSTASVDRRDELSLALIGLRSNLIVSAFQSIVRRLDPAVQVADDLSNGNQVRQRGLNVNASHRLTPESALNLGLAYQRTQTTLSTRGTTLRSFSATWSSRMGPYTGLSAGARRATFDSAVQPYTETAVFATVTATY